MRMVPEVPDAVKPVPVLMPPVVIAQVRMSHEKILPKKNHGQKNNHHSFYLLGTTNLLGFLGRLVPRKARKYPPFPVTLEGKDSTFRFVLL